MTRSVVDLLMRYFAALPFKTRLTVVIEQAHLCAISSSVDGFINTTLRGKDNKKYVCANLAQYTYLQDGKKAGPFWKVLEKKIFL